MIGHIAMAEGSPCPTLVLERDLLPPDAAQLHSALVEIRMRMKSTGLSHVLKLALISRSEHPMFDLDYLFVQCLPGVDEDTFDYLGSCGHSIVASVLVANQLAWLPRLAPGNRVRVNVVNNQDNVVCEMDEVGRTDGNLTVYFLQEPAVSLDRLLVTGSPIDKLATPSGVWPVSVVSMGNPYVFVRTHDLGIHTMDQLFAHDPRLFDTLVDIRRAAGQRWGWPSGSAFPKIAAVGSFSPGQIAVRAISVPTWHPTLALTGATCLATAAAISGTVVHEIAQKAGCEDGKISIKTPGGMTAAYPMVRESAGELQLSWVSVGGKRAKYQGTVLIELLHERLIKESAAWLALSA